LLSLDLTIDEITAKYKTGNQPRPYQIRAISEVIESLKQGNDVAIQLPTGSGKSFIYLPLALSTAEKNYRVCILASTNLLVNQIKNEFLPFFEASINPLIVKGIENYTCLITNQNADYAICTPDQRSNVCVEKYASCDVLYVNKKLEEHGIILTNFHKFLSTPVKNKFDLIIIDDSHGFESAIDGKFITTLGYRHIDSMYNGHESSKDLLSEVAGDFMDKFDDIFDSIPPGKLERRITSEDITKISKIEHVAELKESMLTLDMFDRDICYQMLHFIELCKRSTLNTFYISKDFYNRDDRTYTSLIARNSETSQQRILGKSLGDARIIFVSATMGDIERHAHYCTNRDYKQQGLYVVPNFRPEIIENWFNGLKIFELTDFPEENGLDTSIEKTAEIIPKVSGKILLLFKNYRDQRRAKEILTSSLTKDITFIDDSYNTESVQQLVKGAGIIMATASSRLWEGIDIKDLDFVFIFSLPFIRPPVHIPKEQSFPHVQRKMLIRLQQGIGRLIRKENDKGICVVFAKDFGKYKNRITFSEDYRKQIEKIKFADVEKSILKVVESWK